MKVAISAETFVVCRNKSESSAYVDVTRMWRVWDWREGGIACLCLWLVVVPGVAG